MVDRSDGMEVTHTSIEVCEKTGATYRQLDHWTRSGYIAPVAFTKPNRSKVERTIRRIVKRERRKGVRAVETQQKHDISKYTYYKILETEDPSVDTPDRAPATPGSGYTRVWAEPEVTVIGRMVRLVRSGLSPESAASVARADGEHELTPGVFVRIEDREEADAGG
jgi:hypothetical protein